MKPFIKKLFKILVKCIKGEHLLVTDYALCFFENEYFLKIFEKYSKIGLDLLVPVVDDLAKNHWN